jgi:hypothetical protein
MKRLKNFNLNNWKKSNSIFTLLLLFTLSKNVQAQQFVNITVTWIGGTSNIANCDDQGAGCDLSNPFNTQPDPRWKVAGKLNNDPTFPALQNEGRDDVGPGSSFAWNRSIYLQQLILVLAPFKYMD